MSPGIAVMMRAVQVGPLWMTDPCSETQLASAGASASTGVVSPGLCEKFASNTSGEKGKEHAGTPLRVRVEDGAGGGGGGGAGGAERTEGGDAMLEDVWSWLEPVSVQ